MNILTFDIEEWYIERKYHNNEEWKYLKYDDTLKRLLDLLDSHSIKATFFCLGILAEEFPHVIKSISERGHEIGCHSNYHNWINQMTPDEFHLDTRKAIDSLEQLIGHKVRSYRAPAFSIGEGNKWAFEILAEEGIENDASVFPASRDFGGFPEFNGQDIPCKIIYNNYSINEFPISMTTIPFIGKRIAYSGGGYFRMLPVSFVESKIKEKDYTMCYFHIADLLDFKTKLHTRSEYELYFKESGTLKNRLLRYAKTNLRRKHTFNGLKTLIETFSFSSLDNASKHIQLPIVHI